MTHQRMWKSLTIIFRAICLIFTAVMIGIWYYKYRLNDDLSNIDYKHFLKTEEDFYPVLSLCFRNPFSKESFMHHNTNGVNESSFLRVLEGKSFDEKILNMNYSNLTFNLQEYVEGYWFRWRNGTGKRYSLSNNEEGMFSVSYSGFWHKRFFNCYAVAIPMRKLRSESDEQVEVFSILIKNQIFPNSIRPTNYDFITLLHYPNQLLLSTPTIKYSWPKSSNESTYNIRIIVNAMEILKRRQKFNHYCTNNWQNYDEYVIKKHVQKVGCRAPYHKKIGSIPICGDKEKLKQVQFPLGENIINKYSKPCKAAEKIHYTYQEHSLDGTRFEGKGKFWIGIYLFDSRFKEIIQYR